MRTRPKLFSEFMRGIQIVHRPNGGVKIICTRNNSVLVETETKPWNTPATRKIFLIKIYFKEVLMRVNTMKKIARIPGYELLGRRVLYNEEVLTIVDAEDMVDPESGEMTKRLRLTGRWHTDAPFYLMQNQVQL